MIPYIILFLILLVSGFLEIIQDLKVSKSNIILKKAKTYSKKYVIFPVLIILFLGIFRETTVGHDSQTYYYNYWLRANNFSWLELLTDFSIDNGFFLVLKTISLVTTDWWAARAILFVLTFGLYYIAIRKESPYPSISLLIFIGLAMLGLIFGILRQALAGAVAMFAYKQIRKGSWLKCLLLIIVAATIHKTALICIFMLLIYFLRMKKISGIRLILLSVLSYIAFFVAIPLVTLFYANSRYENIATSDGGYGRLLFLIIVIVLSSYLMRITQTYKDTDLSYTFNLSCGALMVQIGALQWSLLTRATVFFSIYECILLPKLICQLPQRKRLLFYLIFVVVFGFMFFYQLSDVEMFVMHQF